MVTFTVPAGIQSIRVTLANGKIIPRYLTRTLAVFVPGDRVYSSEKGTVAFKRDGAVITLATNALRVSMEVETTIHNAIKGLAGMDVDRARARNGVGFCKQTGEMGHSLARSARLSPKQLMMAAKLVNRFHRQVAPEAVEVAQELLGPSAPKAPKAKQQTLALADEPGPFESDPVTPEGTEEMDGEDAVYADAGGARWNW